MKGEVEEPAGHPLTPSPLVFEPGKLGKSVCNHDVFVTGWFVVLPQYVPPYGRQMKYDLDYSQDRGIMGHYPPSENPKEPLAGVLNDPLRRIRGHEVGKHVEAARGGHSCKLLEPLSDCYIPSAGFDATQEDVETICHEGGVEVSRCCHQEIIQGQQTDRSIQ